MNPISPWAAVAGEKFKASATVSIYKCKLGTMDVSVQLHDDSFWILTKNEFGGRIAFRAAYCAGGTFGLSGVIEKGEQIVFTLSSVIGRFTVNLSLIDGVEPIMQYQTKFRPVADTFIPFWPWDILITSKHGSPENTSGQIHVAQEGTRSGLLYFSLTRPRAGSVMYMQNLTELAEYNEQTKTSSGGVVGGQWPEMGLALPPAIEVPLKANKELVISDAYIVFSSDSPTDEAAVTHQYLNLLARLYTRMPKPETEYNNWPHILQNGLRDLLENPGCMSQVKGNQYFNAYVSDHETPPEIMVQLAVLLPLIDYVEWSGEKIEVIKRIREGLPSFYDEQLGTIRRWLPAAQGKLKGEEEQKKPDVMDSWYLHHPLLNLSRMALKGDKIAHKLFMDSIPFAMKVARHFQYKWPVFYDLKTLEVIKGETQPGKGGEKDVAGLYAHIMLQAFELTKEDKYLREAETAAMTLSGLGFELFYQANNTAFSSGALLRLYKITGKEIYKNLSYLCIANVLKNVQLWDCNYGFGKNFPSFFALFPLNDAPYTAVYEEQEVFCALHDYLNHAEGVDILPSVSLLLAEYIKYLTYRAVYYYPPKLPADMLCEEAKIGEIDNKLWIALEDLHDGWEQSGQVGQEVYGAGNAFGILPRHYIRIPGEDFMIFVEYPKTKVRRSKNEVTLHIQGNHQLACKVRVVANGSKCPDMTISASRQGRIKESKASDGAIEYVVYGDQKLVISWA
ncbi:hypothetical protein [Daejeonella lutea]|uniref:Uncharacterized protein n=1 Tax=Daejeonella lutea TaxID=572036 RepID=A0A1T5CVW8_9SPHI|nr:hypothetical protein [Daejeonella lutea]SKB63655.1 hypothetical protein SAMN05661099_1946 [Daejeonella lutea]